MLSSQGYAGRANSVLVPAAPETLYADTRTGRIAYQIVGDGPIDLLVFFGSFFPIDLMWDEPSLVRFLDRLSTFSRHVWFDPRGRGASDPLRHEEDRFAESGVDDMLALLDHLGLDQVAVIGLCAGPPILFAATHPERTRALVLVNTSAHMRPSDVPARDPQAEGGGHWLQRYMHDWGTGAQLEMMAPSAAGDERLRRWLGRCQRLLCTPDEAYWRGQASYAIDLRPVLGSIRVPTLSIYRSGMAMADQFRYVAQHIAGAKTTELPGEDLLFFAGDSSPMLDTAEEFLTGHLPVHQSERVLATVLFTDIVGSTERANRLGDRRWKELLTTHDALVRAELERFRGVAVKSTGDGILATFDGPGRAIRCACSIRGALGSLGIELRAGLHTGEVELVGDDLAGIAVHIAQRIQARAEPGEVLVSRTVTDLVAGSGIQFEDRGDHELRGVPGSWRLLRVAG